jgi:hypothetical protein
MLSIFPLYRLYKFKKGINQKITRTSYLSIIWHTVKYQQFESIAKKSHPYPNQLFLSLKNFINSSFYKNNCTNLFEFSIQKNKNANGNYKINWIKSAGTNRE